MPAYDENYMKAKVREFNGVIKTNFFSDEKAQRNQTLHLHSPHNY